MVRQQHQFDWAILTYYKDVGEETVAVTASRVPTVTKLRTRELELAEDGANYTSPIVGAWADSRSEAGPLHRGAPGWLSRDRFLESFRGSAVISAIQFERKVECEVAGSRQNAPCEMAADRGCIAPATCVKLAALRPALRVTLHRGLEGGNVSIVTHRAVH